VIANPNTAGAGNGEASSRGFGNSGVDWTFGISGRDLCITTISVIDGSGIIAESTLTNAVAC
jgi:hypothetical protein